MTLSASFDFLDEELSGLYEEEELLDILLGSGAGV
jgi:hypothetical protein